MLQMLLLSYSPFAFSLVVETPKEAGGGREARLLAFVLALRLLPLSVHSLPQQTHHGRLVLDPDVGVRDLELDFGLRDLGLEIRVLVKHRRESPGNLVWGCKLFRVLSK